MANAVIYCRVSTDDQEKEGTSLQTQLDACLKYCHDKGYTVLKHFSDTYTGTALDRPQLTPLRRLLTTGQAHVLVIYCLDRLSRDPTHGVILTQEFEKLGVHLEAVTETVESSDLGRLINYIRGFASKLEVEKIKERTLRGKKAHLDAVRLPTGTGIGPYGYQWDKTTKKRVIIDTEAAIVRRIFTRAIQGQSLSQIAKDLNDDRVITKTGLVWCHTTVRRVITNPIYCGDTYYGRRKRVDKTKVQHQNKDTWILLPDVTPPIITREMFTHAQEAITARHIPTRLTNSAYFLTGLSSCPDCGSPLTGATLNKRYRYYCCRGTRPTRTRSRICNANYIKAEELESYVWDRFAKLASSPLTVLSHWTDLGYDSSRKPDIGPMIDRQIATLQNRLKTYHQRKRNLLHFLADDRITTDDVNAEIDRLTKQEAEDDDQLQQLKESHQRANGHMRITTRLSQYSQDLKDALSKPLTPAKKKEFLHAYQVRVTATPGKYRFTVTPFGITSEDWDEQQDSDFSDLVKHMEHKHPEITIVDLADHARMLPEDTPLLKASNQIKKTRLAQAKPRKPASSTDRSYITIEQTSA